MKRRRRVDGLDQSLHGSLHIDLPDQVKDKMLDTDLQPRKRLPTCHSSSRLSPPSRRTRAQCSCAFCTEGITIHSVFVKVHHHRHGSAGDESRQSTSTVLHSTDLVCAAFFLLRLVTVKDRMAVVDLCVAACYYTRQPYCTQTETANTNFKSVRVCQSFNALPIFVPL